MALAGKIAHIHNNETKSLTFMKHGGKGGKGGYEGKAKGGAGLGGN